MKTNDEKSTWREEFGDAYDVPNIPGNWIDESWHNDMCPRFRSADFPGVAIWVEHINEEERECGTLTPRFVVTRYDDAEFMENGTEIFASNSFPALCEWLQVGMVQQIELKEGAGREAKQ